MLEDERNDCVRNIEDRLRSEFELVIEVGFLKIIYMKIDEFLVNGLYRN